MVALSPTTAENSSLSRSIWRCVDVELISGIGDDISDLAPLDHSRSAMHFHTLVIGTEEPDLQRLCRLSCPRQGNAKDRQTFRDRGKPQRIDFRADLVD